MKIGFPLGIACALLVHAGFILFGGLIFKSDKQDHGTMQEVELVAPEDVAEEKKKPEETIADASAPAENESEQPPEASEVVRSLDMTAAFDDAPELEAASLSAIEAALSGQASGSGGDFAQALNFASGGRIDGKGRVGASGEATEDAFSMDEVDQEPRLITQIQPIYPSDMRGKKVEGKVTVVFVVDVEGKVSNPRAEDASHASFAKPAIDAIKKWKFEPAVRAGERVPKKMRIQIRFPVS